MQHITHIHRAKLQNSKNSANLPTQKDNTQEKYCIFCRHHCSLPGYDDADRAVLSNPRHWQVCRPCQVIHAATASHTHKNPRRLCRTVRGCIVGGRKYSTLKGLSVR
jgi:hypothetical protein